MSAGAVSEPKIKRCPSCGEGVAEWALCYDMPNRVAVFCGLDDGGCGMIGPAIARRHGDPTGITAAPAAIAAWNALHGPGRPGKRKGDRIRRPSLEEAERAVDDLRRAAWCEFRPGARLVAEPARAALLAMLGHPAEIDAREGGEVAR